MISKKAKIIAIFLVLALSLFLVSCAASKQKTEQAKTEQIAPEQNPMADKPLPVDPKVKIGKLDNGMTYYIRQNQRPENRAELRLVVNAGSILEDSSQQGLAHFVEHMAFNGTKSFKKHEMLDYLESFGMRLGPDLNAYTSFDETVYMLQGAHGQHRIISQSFSYFERDVSTIWHLKMKRLIKNAA